MALWTELRGSRLPRTLRYDLTSKDKIRLVVQAFKSLPEQDRAAALQIVTATGTAVGVGG
jgi:hypothetical protein